MTAAISIRGITKAYDGRTVLDGPSLEIERGEIFAILGPNGAGKTTLVEILEGYRDRDGGDVTVVGEDPQRPSDSAAWRNKIGIVLQNVSDAGDLTVREVVENFAHYYTNPKNPAEVIKKVGLEEKRGAKVTTLSGGQRRRLDVALGMIGSPEVLFLDEPTTGFDPEARREFWELIRSLRDEGTTILLTTHYLDEAEQLADRVAVLAAGRILEIAKPGDLGGRRSKGAIVSWSDDAGEHSEETLTPTAFVLALAAKTGGEIQHLQIKNPTLEDIYIEMIEGAQ